MRHVMKRIWHTVREYVAHRTAAGSTRVAGEAPPRPAPPADVVAQPAPGAAPPPVAPPGMPAIAVLPFNNLTGEIDEDYLGDGIAEDITTQLSYSNALFVVARRLSGTFKGRTVKLDQLGRELGAGYVLGGNVRRDGEQVQINARLMETVTGKQVWAKRFDRAMIDLPEVQDAIADEVALAIMPGISPVERQRIACKPIVPQRVVVGATASGT
jgi:adenylate cyclase